jgi:probable F420-dependent oxidoreductase
LSQTVSRPETHVNFEMARFRFSLQMSRVNGRDAWLSGAARAEDLGYDLIMTADHLTACAPPLIALMSAAQATSVIRLGTLVINNDLRHPSVLAREAIALDVLSDGRFELGIGAGWARDEYQRSGLRFDPASVRIARMAESAGLLRRLLDGEVVEHAGEHYQMRGERCEQRPAQAHVPLIIGGGGPVLLAAAARIADTVAISAVGRDRRAEHVDRQIEWIRHAAAGRTPEIQLLVHTALVSPRRSDAEEALAARLPELSATEALESPYALVGSPDAIAEKLMAQHDRWGITHYTVRADAMTTFAPVLTRMRDHLVSAQSA